MKTWLFIALAGVALGLSGCFSLESADVKMTNEEHVLARNFGWRLFNWIPLACGNASKDAECSFVLFRDDVTMEKVQSRFVDYAAGREILDPTYHNCDSVFFNIVGIPFPIPYVICYREVSLSGTIRKDMAR